MFMLRVMLPFLLLFSKSIETGPNIAPYLSVFSVDDAPSGMQTFALCYGQTR